VSPAAVRGTQIVVVGAGIVGASVGYHAARLGARVTLVDRGLPACGVTGDSFAWIGASGVRPGPAAPLRALATSEYRRLEGELPAVRVRWSGSLSWSGWDAPSTVPGTGPDDDLAQLDDMAQLDAAAVRVLEPDLREPPVTALHIVGDGAVDPVAVTEALVAGAREHGARVLVGTTVTAGRTGSGRVLGVDTSSGPLDADTVVLAAGVDVPVLCAPLGFSLPVAPSPALLVRFSTPAAMVRTLVAGPDVEVRATADGTLVAALAHHGESTSEELAATAQRALETLRTMFRGTDGLRVTSARIGWRPMPADGEPVLGPVPGVRGLHLAVMHSGVSLAAAAGRLVAEELVRGEEAPELRGCRPTRFRTGPR
jgi:glycine/D-amino acid oxidase-like deaminating enzyme